jgi:hypothetical protein
MFVQVLDMLSRKFHPDFDRTIVRAGSHELAVFAPFYTPNRTLSTELIFIVLN